MVAQEQVVAVALTGEQVAVTMPYTAVVTRDAGKMPKNRDADSGTIPPTFGSRSVSEWGSAACGAIEP